MFLCPKWFHDKARALKFRTKLGVQAMNRREDAEAAVKCLKTAKFCLSLLNRVPPDTTSLDPTARKLEHLNSVFGMVPYFY